MSPDVVKFPIGSEVFHKCSEDLGIVIGIMYRESGIMYEVVWSNVSGGTWHQPCELQKEPVKTSEITGDEEDDDKEFN